MILITSAAYINPSLASEFGLLPPTMLPVQNKRLYQHQLSLFEHSQETIAISLPESYSILNHDKLILDSLGVKTIYVPDKFTLGQSIVYCLNCLGQYDEPVYILHGDTLFKEVDLIPDSCYISYAEDDYTWARSDSQKSSVYAGFFSFSSQAKLLRCITEKGYDFIKGIEAYAKDCELKEIENDTWMDFGLVNTYYRSVSRMTTQRSFNSLESNFFSLKKSSTDKIKMRGEANWIQSLPSSLKHYAPPLWDAGETENTGYYEIEYYYLSSLANLFVFGKNPTFIWNDVLNACNKFIEDINLFKPNRDILEDVLKQNTELYLPKTKKRLSEFTSQTGLSLTHKWVYNGVELPSLSEIAEITATMITPCPLEFISIMHGDFCFSNILYDFKSKSIKVIDPRGVDLNGNLSIYGDIRYDIAKLAHSILGLYDYIVGGIFNYEEHGTYDLSFSIEINETIRDVQKQLLNLDFMGFCLKDLCTYPIMVHLFLSMLPLHADNPLRQKAFLANSLRLFHYLISQEK